MMMRHTMARATRLRRPPTVALTLAVTSIFNRGVCSTPETFNVDTNGLVALRRLPKNTTALLIIDPQFDFVEGGALACIDTAPTSSLWTEIAALQSKPFAAYYVTKDWHPKDHISFASNNGLEPYSIKEFDVADTDETNKRTGKSTRVRQVMWPPHCVQGTHGAEFAVPIHPHAVIVTKGTHSLTDSYSGFGDGMSARGQYPKTYETSILKGDLEARGIRHVVITGIATDFCVRATAMDALAYGFDVTLVEAAVRGVAVDTSAAALLEMAAAGVSVIRSAAEVELVATA